MTRLFVSQASPECPPKAANGYLLWWMCEPDSTNVAKQVGRSSHHLLSTFLYHKATLLYSYNTIIISIIIFIKQQAAE